MLGFNDSSDNILYGLQHEGEHSASTSSPVATTTTGTASCASTSTPEASPDLQSPCASASQSRSSSFSLSRSSSFSVPALSATASPSLAEVFLRGPSTEKAALQQYLMGLADTTSTSASGSGSGSNKRKRRNDSDAKKKSRKSRRTAASKKTAERTNAKAAAQRANATSTPTEAITTTATQSTCAVSQCTGMPTTHAGVACSSPSLLAQTSTPVVASPAVPYSSPSLYFSSMPSPCSSFSSYTTVSTPTLPSTPYEASYYYPNVLFDAPSPAVYQHQQLQAFQPQYEDDDFWLEVEAVLPTRAQQQQQQCFEQPQLAFFNSSFCELERFLLENDF